ncbi:MAG: SRPBCC family protein [Candidatus Pristimantibacillus sp.]
MSENTLRETAVEVQNRGILLNRTLNAPQDLVWEVWTQPEHLANWWGPQGFTITTSMFNFQPGGIWKFTMTGPDGVEYPNQIVFMEIQKPERILYAASDGDEDSQGQFQTTITFSKDGDKTLVTMQMLFKTSEERDYVVKEYGAIENGNQTLDRLSELLESLRSQ